LKRGDVVGLPSMFTHLVSVADVVAKTPIRAFVAGHAQFHPLVSDPEIEIRFKAAVFDRLRDEIRQLEQALAKRRSTAKPS
jgi:CRP-like cAMP-binding protein